MKNTLIEMFQCILLDNRTEMKNILLLLQIMMTKYTSTATCEREFSKSNIEKTYLCTTMNNQAFSDNMCISINSTSLEEFNPEIVLVRWLEAMPGRRHLVRQNTV